MAKLKLAVIGCGLRANAYMLHLAADLGTAWDLVALADPTPEHRRAFEKRYAPDGAAHFESGPELLEQMGKALDAVIICSPNAEHRAALVPALRHGLIVLLEKPVATTLDDCAAMWQAHESAVSPKVGLGIVLRHTPLCRQVKQIIDRGDLGRILTIEAAEMMGPSLTALFLRGWRRLEQHAGPLINEKCSHDRDLLNWFVGSAPTHVSSFASLTRFVPRADAADRCTECQLIDTCRYSVKKLSPYVIDAKQREQLGDLVAIRNDSCVFNNDKDIPDHQTVQIAYANGVLVNFVVAMDQPNTNRLLRITGTEGQLSADMHANLIRVTYHDRGGAGAELTEEIKVQLDSVSHYGGDAEVVRRFRAMLRGEPAEPLASLRDGIEACAVGFAAERARREGRVVDIQHEVMAEVFGRSAPLVESA